MGGLHGAREREPARCTGREKVFTVTLSLRLNSRRARSLAQVRKDKGLPEHLPPNSRWQVDGVSTNWGKVVFAHIEHLIKQRVLGDASNVARNPVGSTHEDVDALFALIKQLLKNADIVTFSLLIALIKRAFATYQLPVTIFEVDATFDYIAFYTPHIDKKLANFSYSDKQTGYHLLAFRPVSLEFPTGVSFKKYQQDSFMTVAVSKDQLPESVALALPDNARFMPQRMIIHNSFEPAHVLVSTPTGKPNVVLHDYDWDRVARDVRHVLANHAHNDGHLREWDDFITKRKSRPTDGLPSWNWPIRPNDAGAARSADNVARATVADGTLEVEQPRQVASTFYNGAEGVAAAQAAARVRDHVAGATRRETLEALSFAMVRMNYEHLDADSPGNRVPLVIVQLPANFGEADTTAEDADIRDVRKYSLAINPSEVHANSSERGEILAILLRPPSSHSFSRARRCCGGSRCRASTASRGASGATTQQSSSTSRPSNATSYT